MANEETNEKIAMQTESQGFPGRSLHPDTRKQIQETGVQDEELTDEQKMTKAFEEAKAEQEAETAEMKAEVQAVRKRERERREAQENDSVDAQSAQSFGKVGASAMRGEDDELG